MAQPTYFQPGPWGEFAARESHYSQAVRIGDYIEISGQGGWDPVSLKIADAQDEAGQIAQAFQNIDNVLRASGAKNGWGSVYKVRSYHVPITDKSLELTVAQLRKYCPDHKPTWTMLGIDKLALDEMRVEIEVTAFVGNGN